VTRGMQRIADQMSAMVQGRLQPPRMVFILRDELEDQFRSFHLGSPDAAGDVSDCFDPGRAPAPPSP